MIPAGHPLRGKLAEFTRERFNETPERRTQRLYERERGKLVKPIAVLALRVDRTFSPTMIDLSLDVRVDSHLTPAQLNAATRAADVLGWRRDASRRDEAVIRPLGLSDHEQDRARVWLLRLAEAADRHDRIAGHFTGDPELGLDQPGQQRLVEEALEGLVPIQALVLLEDITDDDLKVLVASDLIGQLETALPPGHPIRDHADNLRAQRLFGRRVIEPTKPARPFGLEMISRQLADIGVRRDLTPEELSRVGTAIAGRSFTEVAVGLPTNQMVQKARFEWWWREVAESALLVRAAWEYLDGSLAIAADDDLRSVLIDPLLLRPEQTAWQALELLYALDDERLGGLFADAQLRAGLEQAIPDTDGLRPRLEEFFRTRFDEQGQVQAVHAERSFSLRMISEDLAEAKIGDPLTTEQLMMVAPALAGRPDADITDPLDLPPVEAARARRWVRAVRDAMVDWVPRYLAGIPGYDMPALEMWALARFLLAEPVSDRGRRAVLALLEGIDDAQLERLFGDATLDYLFADHPQLAGLFGRRLNELLEEVIPSEHELRPRLDAVLRVRFDDQGQVQVVYPEQPFRLDLISEELADFDVSGRELSADFVEYLGLVLERRYTEPFASGVNAELAQLSPVGQAEAMSWLARAAGALHDSLAEQRPRPELSDQVRALHELLSSLQADAARRIADDNDLGELTVTPLAGQIGQLREALAPAARAVDEEATSGDFRKSLDGQDLDFGDRLRQAFLKEIDGDEIDLVHKKGPAERAEPGNLYSADHIQQIADLMTTWVAEVFGGLAPVPQRMRVAEPGRSGEIYDGYAYREWEWQSWSPHTYREEARRYLQGFLLGDRPTDQPASVAADHGADVSFTWPFNDETKIADQVMNDLLSDPQIVTRINEIERGWLGRHEPDSGHILLSFVREEGKDTETLWGTAYRLVHEIMHHLEHPEFDRWENSFHSIELATLKEGIPTLLGDMVWAHAVARLRETGQDGQENLETWNRIILGPFYTEGVNPSNLWDQALPHRYEAVTQATRLVGLVGLENLLAAFFGGQWWKVAGPVPSADGSILAPRGWTEPSPSPSRTPSLSPSTSPDESSSDSSSESSDEDGR